MKKRKVYGLLFFLFTTLLLLSLYFPLTQKYFEQDEWHNFGFNIYNISELTALELLKTVFFHSLPVTQLYNYVNFTLFGVNNLFPALTVIGLVLLNSYLWFKNVFKISGNRYIAFGSVLFAYISPIALQSVTWVIPAVASQLSFLFLNLSLVFFLKFLDDSRKKSLIFVAIFVLLAIFSKQNSVFLVLFYPFLYLVKKGISKENLYEIGKYFIVPFTVLIGLYLLKIGGIRIGESRFVGSLNDLFINILVLPIKSVSQLLFPYPSFFYEIPVNLKVYNFFSSFDINKPEDIILYVQMSLSVIFLIGCGYVFYFYRGNLLRKTFVIFLVFYLLSFLPFTLDKFSTGNLYMESRYYQLSAFGLGVVVSVILVMIIELVSKYKRFHQLFILVIVFFGSVYLVNNYYEIKSQIHKQVQVTQTRKEILSYLEKIIPNDEKSIIIYTHNINHSGSENITGEYFQTGLLYPFLVHSYPAPYSYPKYFRDDTLWDYTFQGVITNDGYTAGIFYEYSKLVDYIKKYPESINKVYAIEFDYKRIFQSDKAEGNFYDIQYVEYSNVTEDVRNKLLKTNEIFTN